MKKYKVNGKIVVADSLREAIVKYRDAQNYSAGQKFRDPKGRIWEVKSANGDLLTIAVDGKEMSNKLHKEIFAEWAKTWDVADSLKEGKLVVETYCINKGQPGEYYGLKTDEGDVLHYAPNNWKTESAAIKWALNHGYAVADSADSIKDFLEPKIGQKYRGKVSGGILQVIDIYTEGGQKWVRTIDLKTGYKTSTNYPTFIRLLLEPINDSADSVKDYDDEYYEIRYEFTFNGVKRTAKVLVKAKAETDAKSKFANDKTKDGTEKIISVKKLSEDEVKKLIGYGVYVIDGVIKNKQDIINAVRNSQMMEEALKYNTKDKLSKSPSFVYHVKNLINKIAFDSEYELTVKEEAEILNEVLYK